MDEEVFHSPVAIEPHLKSYHHHEHKPDDEDDKIEDFDDMLDYVGGWNKYQFIQLGFFIIITMFLGYLTYSPILILYAPDHWCKVPALENRSLTPEEIVRLAIPLDEEGERSKCEMYDVDFSNLPDDVVVNPDWKRKPCDNGWTYNLTGYFSTMTSESNWVCQDAWKASFSQSMFFTGATVGSFGFGVAADHFGRYKICLITNILLLVSGIALGFCPDFESFTALRFIMGLCYRLHFSSFYILAMEYVKVSKRSFVGNISLAISLTLAGVYLPWLMYWVQDWRIFHHILFGQVAVIFIMPWFLHESCRWLMTKGRIEECVEILEDIAKMNKKHVTPKVYQLFREMCKENHRPELKRTLKDFTSRHRLCKNIAAAFVSMVLCSLLFDANIRNIVNLNLDIYTTFTVSMILEFPADILAIFGLNIIGRRWSMVIAFALSGICMILVIPVRDNDLAALILAMSGRFFITYSLNATLQTVIEVFPTEIRGRGLAIAMTASEAISMLSPFIVYTGNNGSYAPFLIIGLIGLLASAVSLFIPETADEDLAETLEEGEEFGKDQKFFSFFPVDKWKKSRQKKEQRNASSGLSNPAFQNMTMEKSE